MMFRTIGLTLATLCGLAWGNTAGRAEEKNAAEPVRPAVIRRIAPVPRAAMATRADWFDSWVFGGITSADAKTRLQQLGDQRIALLKQLCELDDHQVAKLELAKRGDMARFFQRVESVRREAGDRQPDRNNMQELMKLIGPLQVEWNAKLAGSNSLFVAVAKNVLTEEQITRLRTEETRRTTEQNRYHAMSMIKMLEQSIPLNDRQRKRLMELVLETAKGIRVHENMQAYVSIYAASQLDDSELQGLLDKEQLAAFDQLRKHWRTNMPFLDQMIRQRADQNEEWLSVLR